MNFERGSRRLLVVVSIALLSVGAALDMGRLWSHAVIYVTTSFGEMLKYETWALSGSPPYEQDPATRRMVEDILRMPISRAPETPGAGPRFIDPLRGTVALDPAPLAPGSFSPYTFRIVRGPSAWSWDDIKFTPMAAGVVLLLWAGFFSIRWIAKGFRYHLNFAPKLTDPSISEVPNDPLIHPLGGAKYFLHGASDQWRQGKWRRDWV
jgi:hypothetical protein